MFNLRYYQTDALVKVFTMWETIKSLLVVMPTGTGKTIFFAAVCEELVKRGLRVLILAHRGELLDQAKDKISKSTGLGCAIEKAELSCLDSFYNIVVGSVQTMYKDKRLNNFPKNYFDVIVIDEAHHAPAQTYRNIVNYFEDALLLGVTATPDRTDMRNLGEVFQDLAYEYTLPKAINDGFLVRIEVQTIPIKIDISGMSKGKEYKRSEIGTTLEPYLEQIALEMVNHCRDKKTVVFMPLIATSQKFQKILDRHGFKTFEVNGDSEDRDDIIKAFDKAGKNTVMLNAMLLTEGWDCASIDALINLRCTKSRQLYVQMVGRGLRPTVAHEISMPGLTSEQRRDIISNSNKPSLMLLDFIWNIGSHELCKPASLVAPDRQTENVMNEKIEKNQGAPIDILSSDFIDEAESDVQTQREQAMAERIREAAKKKRMLVDPLEYEMKIMGMDLTNYEPTQLWERAPVTPEQEKALEKMGIYAGNIDNSGKAEKILECALDRKMKGMSTAKQVRFLENKGFRNVSKWTSEQASKMTARISANGWAVPHSINPTTYEPPINLKDFSL